MSRLRSTPTRLRQFALYWSTTSFVEEIHPWTTGEYVLRIKGGKQLIVSRTYKENLKCIAQFWVGPNGPFVE